MKLTRFKTVLGVLAGFAAGFFASNLPSAIAALNTAPKELSSKAFEVAVFEVKQKLTPGKFLETEFSGSYTQTVTMSDGKQRRIELTPMLHKGMQVVRLQDSGHTSYMGLNGTTLNGTLLVQLRDKEATEASLKAEGWPGQ
ncbi:hypothetical protein LE190_13880 [Massilia oculi]|uniref:DUF5666 domain-containing protein n=1 Tax=Massilia hydrophila TaxID=3044279 RepID=A0ABS7YBD5_9BURK|nr:hypothetical protein [Massilia oculi]MCA1857006.1 hypothetical protein [Massilia oculi]